MHVFGFLRIQITLHYFIGVGNFKIFSLDGVSKIAILLQKFNLYEYTMERTASMGPYLKTTYIIEGFVL